MKKFAFAFTLSLAAMSAAEMTGWISDSSCGKSNASASAESRACAERCLKGGSTAVFVDDASGKVFKLNDSKKASTLTKNKVKVNGTVKGDTIEIASIDYVK
jgi:hypothetical protein